MADGARDLRRDLLRRRRREAWFGRLCLAMCLLALVVLLILLVAIGWQGGPHLNAGFLINLPSRFAHQAGIKLSLLGTLYIFVLTAGVAVPVGVAAAVYLEEYAPKNRLNRLLEVTIANLAGVPSIVYGMLGLVLFVRLMSLGRSIIAGALTLALLILPVIIIASREAIRAVPLTLRQASYALGGTQWQTTRHHVLPAALPGIVTSVILAMSRAIGETAPLILVGAAGFVSRAPSKLTDPFMVLPITIYQWASRPQKDFHDIAAAGIIVLLAALLSMNAVAVYIRYRAEKENRW